MLYFVSHLILCGCDMDGSVVVHLLEYLVNDVARVVMTYMECMAPGCKELVSSPRYWFCANCVIKAGKNFDSEGFYGPNAYYGAYSRYYLFILTWNCFYCSFRIIPHSQTRYTNFGDTLQLHFYQQEVDRLLEGKNKLFLNSGHNGHHMRYCSSTASEKWGWVEENGNTRLAEKDVVLRTEWELFCFQVIEVQNYLFCLTKDKYGLERILEFVVEFSAHKFVV